jgi:hypothetical protein
MAVSVPVWLDEPGAHAAFAKLTPSTGAMQLETTVLVPNGAGAPATEPGTQAVAVYSPLAGSRQAVTCEMVPRAEKVPAEHANVAYWLEVVGVHGAVTLSTPALPGEPIEHVAET